MSRDRDPLALPSRNTSTTDATGLARQSQGVGQAAQHMVQATRTGKYPDDNTGEGRSQGETPGAGTIHAAVLVERPQMSNTRNLGPERAGSRQGTASIPVVTMMSRNTGKI